VRSAGERTARLEERGHAGLDRDTQHPTASRDDSQDWALSPCCSLPHSPDLRTLRLGLWPVPASPVSRRPPRASGQRGRLCGTPVAGWVWRRRVSRFSPSAGSMGSTRATLWMSSKPAWFRAAGGGVTWRRCRRRGPTSLPPRWAGWCTRSGESITSTRPTSWRRSTRGWVVGRRVVPFPNHATGPERRAWVVCSMSLVVLSSPTVSRARWLFMTPSRTPGGRWPRCPRFGSGSGWWRRAATCMRSAGVTWLASP
jgi:hypothetical protein